MRPKERRTLSENPYTVLLQIKKLRGPEKLYRIRIGDYRLVYTVESSDLIVIVVKIGHRREIIVGPRTGSTVPSESIGPSPGQAVFPDLKWIASSGEDNTLGLWPMPDLSKPPLQTLPTTN